MIVDIHNHILPGLDDGPKSMDEAILLVKNAAANGVTQIIATPHRNSTYSNDVTEIKEAVKNLNEEIALEDIPVEVFIGQEIHLTNFLDMDKMGELLTLAGSGKYILVELPDDHFPLFTYDVIFQLQLKGYIPIIPHPERNVILRRRKEMLYELVTKGVLVQITASSLIGKQGRTKKNYSIDLIKHNLVHFIASDAHECKHRPFLIETAYKFIDKKFSTNKRNYFIDNARHVLFGTEFKPLPPIGFK